MQIDNPDIPSNQPPAAVRTSAVVAWLRLMRIYLKVERLGADRFRERSMSLAQFDVLAHVGAREGMRQQELADSLLVTKGNVTQLLDRMEHCGYLARHQHGRSNRIYLTEKGRCLFEEAVPCHEGMIDQIFSVLSAEEQVQLVDLLNKLDHSLD